MAVLIFDMMGIIFTEGHIIKNVLHPMLQKRFPGLTYEAVKEPYDRYSIGQLNRLGFWLALGIKDYEQFEKEFLDSFKLAPDFIEMAEYLRSKGHEIIIFSNMPAEWACYLIQKSGIDKYISARIISGETGFRKPDPAAYDMVAEKVGTQEAYFIDNKSENLSVAARYGWKTITFGEEISFKSDHIIKSLTELKSIL
ncbi:MAG: HAD-IA family hydrolase [Candidatus Aenigmatarchaeota archaeon]|nr:HAD-IA family hydrolase [Candidatus Aenigmarchaeota archaeon]